MCTSMDFLGCNVYHQKVLKQIYATVYSILFMLGDSKNVGALFQESGLWEGTQPRSTQTLPCLAGKSLVVQNWRGGGLTCELPVALTAISKRKVTPLPVEGLILLYMSTQMAGFSLGLFFKNCGK